MYLWDGWVLLARWKQLLQDPPPIYKTKTFALEHVVCNLVYCASSDSLRLSFAWLTPVGHYRHRKTRDSTTDTLYLVL
jgi:hypothetical protein